MDIFNVLSLIGGLCLFLFGMNVMGQALERRAGNSLRSLLSRMTSKRIAGFFTGMGITAVIQSSSATTVMVVGFVNSGLMSLRQAINVIMGANVGTTITAWLLSLSGIDSSAIWVRMLKPSSFTPILALIGIMCFMFGKSDKKKDTGTILLAFATLMFGMETMSSAVSGLADIPAFQQLFIVFKNPILGVLAGTVLTMVIQSSSASIGVLQALAATGQVSYGAAIPIIMGDAIGTCVTAMISSAGAKKEAKRAALVHLAFNIIGTTVWLTVFWLIEAIFKPMILDESASLVGIAVVNSVFKVLCTILLLPMAGLLEKLVKKLIPDAKIPEKSVELDERLLATPPLALERCHKLAIDVARGSMSSLKDAIASLTHYTPELAGRIRRQEEITDHYEDALGSYLVRLSSQQLSEADSCEATKLLKVIGDFERISDHAVNLLESAEEMREKKIVFTKDALAELKVLFSAVNEILDLSLTCFEHDDVKAAEMVESLEQVIDDLKEQMRTRHILRLQQSACSIEAGFVWSDLLTNLERTSDHCSNIAGCVIDVVHNNLNLHESLRAIRTESPEYFRLCKVYAEKYQLAEF